MWPKHYQNLLARFTTLAYVVIILFRKKIVYPDKNMYKRDVLEMGCYNDIKFKLLIF